MNYKIAIGIDIGSNGAWAAFVNDKLSYGLLPYSSDEPDMRAFFDHLLELIPKLEDDDDLKIHAVIEDLHSIFGTSARSNFSFGINNGLIIATLQILEFPFTKVQPKRWQKSMWEGIRPIEIPTGKKDKKGNPKHKIDTKQTSLIAAQRLFPKETFLATERSKVPNNNIVDAVLMCEFCRRNYL